DALAEDRVAGGGGRGAVGLLAELDRRVDLGGEPYLVGGGQGHRDVPLSGVGVRDIEHGKVNVVRVRVGAVVGPPGARLRGPDLAVVDDVVRAPVGDQVGQ